MTTLHLLSRSPFVDGSLNSCLRLLAAGDGVLLTGDAVYALQANAAPWVALSQLSDKVPLFALLEDVEARAMAVPERVQLVDYVAFVALTLTFSKVNSWL